MGISQYWLTRQYLVLCNCFSLPYGLFPLDTLLSGCLINQMQLDSWCFEPSQPLGVTSGPYQMQPRVKFVSEFEKAGCYRHCLFSFNRSENRSKQNETSASVKQNSLCTESSSFIRSFWVSPERTAWPSHLCGKVLVSSNPTRASSSWKPSPSYWQGVHESITPQVRLMVCVCVCVCVCERERGLCLCVCVHLWICVHCYPFFRGGGGVMVRCVRGRGWKRQSMGQVSVIK